MTPNCFYAPFRVPMCCLPYKTSSLHYRNTLDVFSSTLSSRVSPAHTVSLGRALTHAHRANATGAWIQYETPAGCSTRKTPATGRCCQHSPKSGRNLCVIPRSWAQPPRQGTLSEQSSESPRVSMGCSRCRHLWHGAFRTQQAPEPTRGWEQQHSDARDGAARGPSTF